MRDREDCKSGWAMEQEFEAKERKRKAREAFEEWADKDEEKDCLLYTSPSPRD